MVPRDAHEVAPRGSASIYGSKAYWDDRYSDPRATIGASTAKGVTNNEWYVGFDVLKPHLLEYAGRNAHCVLLGCGTSTLGEDMAENGFARVAAVDLRAPSSARSARAQQTRLAKLARSPPERPPPHPFEVDYRVMDVKNMTYPRETFDCVIDKATLDTMCQLDEDPCEAGPPPSSANAVDFRGQRRRKNNPPSPPPTHAGRMLEEGVRVLKPGGRYVCLSYGEPDDRLGMLTGPGLSWGMEAQREIRKGKAGVYFLSSCGSSRRRRPSRGTRSSTRTPSSAWGRSSWAWGGATRPCPCSRIRSTGASWISEDGAHGG